jgi:hypothetical protein
MRWALLISLILSTGLLAGCGSANPRVRREIALLRGEIIDLENQYYALKSMYREETGREPDFSSVGLRAENRSAESWLETPAAGGVCLDCGQPHDPRQPPDHPLRIDNGGTSPAAGGKEPKRQSRDDEAEAWEDPVIEFGPEEVPLPDDGQSSGFRRPVSQVGVESVDQMPAAGASAPGPVAGNGLVDFEIDPRWTQGYDSDGLPGAEGIAFRLLPRLANARERGLGELTLSVIDPEVEPARQRLGLWKLTPAEVAGLVKQVGSQTVVEARFPWQRGPAQHENLLLFARFRTPDGRTIEKSASFLAASGNSAAELPGVDGSFEVNGSDSRLAPGVEEIQGAGTTVKSGAPSGPTSPAWRPIR